MRRILLPIAFVALIAQQGTSQTLYSETFNTLTLSSAGVASIPSNMIGINANNASGATSANNAPFNAAPYLTTAFVSLAVNSGADTAAACTSWLNPVGAADKWLITPAIVGVDANTILSWEALASDASYPDGYQVWVSVAAGASGSPTVADFTGIASNKVFTIAAEGSTGFIPHSVSLAAFAGQTVRVAFRDNSNDMFKLYIDDIKVLVPSANDIALTSISPSGQAVWGAVSSTKTITGTVKNNGLNPITTFSATYNNGVVNASSTFTGLNLAYGATYNFTIATPYTITTAAQANLKVYVNLASDANHGNDTLASGIAGYSFLPTHKVVMEEGTGTWCGWCVRGAVYMDSIASVYPNTVVPIAVHNGDPMVNSAYDTGIGALISGYPTLLVDRNKFIGDPTDAFTEYTNHINDFALANLTVNQTFNTSTRLLTVTANANMASSFTNNSSVNDYRLAVVVTENQVHGTTSTYNQANYYSGGGSGPMAGAGHDFAAEPDPVLAANMYYDFVARTILGGFSGQANSLPASVVAGSTYNYTFTYTVPASYNVNNMKINALLIDAKNNIIYNANSASLVLGITSIDAKKQTFTLYPNPATSVLNMDLQLEESDDVTVSIMNSLGEVVMTKNVGTLLSGKNLLTFDVNELASGVYIVNVNTSKGVGMSKFVK